MFGNPSSVSSKAISCKLAQQDYKIRTFTIGKKTCESTQKIWYFLLFRKITLIFVSNKYNPQPRGNLTWTKQGLKFGGMIWGQQLFLNFNNGYVGGLKSQHVWLITLWINLNLRRRLCCQKPISLKVFVPPC